MTSIIPTQLPRAMQGAIDSMEGRLPVQWRNRTKDFFMLTGSLLPLAASGTGTIDMAVQGDSDFVIFAAVSTVVDVANTTRLTFVPQLVALTNSVSGRAFQTEATHFHNVFGTAEEPCLWLQPKLLGAGGVFSVTHTNQEATARNVRDCFYGFKLFRTMRDAGLNE